MHNTLSTAQAAAPGAERFAVLGMDGRQLLVPQHELLGLEPAQDLRPLPRNASRTLGQIVLGAEKIPVYCLTPQLELADAAPAGRRICSLLQSTQHGLFGLLCDQVTVLHAEAADRQPLPECMQLPGTPVRSLIRSGERVLCASSAGDLANLIANSAVAATDRRQEGALPDDGG